MMNKTFKLTLALFFMLLAGTQALSDQRINRGCRMLLNNGSYKFIRNYATRSWIENPEKRNKYKTFPDGTWAQGAGFEKMLDVGCQWCANRSVEGGFQEKHKARKARCDAFKHELNLYIRFKTRSYNGQYGTIKAPEDQMRPYDAFCHGRKRCTQKDVDAGKICKTVKKGSLTYIGNKCNNKINDLGFAVCESTGDRQPSNNCRVDFDNGGKAYGPGHLEINGWWVPQKWQNNAVLRLGEKFETLEKAFDCFTRGCTEPGFTGVSFDEDLEELPQAAFNPMRKTVDILPPVVSQSKGFDIYQTVLIVGLCVATAFITTGVIYKCRGGEQKIELAMDAEDKIVVETV